MKNKLLKIIIYSTILLSLTSCTITYDTMMDSFNKKFSPTSTSKIKETPSVKDEDFDPHSMLSQEIYRVPSHSLLVLQGPSDCLSYKWTAKVPKTGYVNVIVDTVIGEEKVLSYQMPGVFRYAVDNVLVLTVIGENGVEYTDKANIVLYNMD